MQTARNTQTAAAAAAWGYQPLEMLLPYHPEFIVRRPKQLLTRYAQTLEHRVHRVRIGFGDGLRRLSDAQFHRITEKSVDERTGNGIGFIRQNGVLDATGFSSASVSHTPAYGWVR